MNIVRKIFLPVIIIAAGVFGLIILSTMKQPAEQKAKIDKTPVVDVFIVEVQPYQLIVESQGISEPLSRTQLIANVSGVVLSYNSAFNAGGIVAEGEVLVEIEKLDYLSAVKSAEANLARAKAGFTEEQARAQIAADEYAREGRTGNAPVLGLRKPQLAREKANMQSAEAELESAKRNLQRTTIVAPYNAIVAKRNIDIGQLVAINSSLGEIMATDIATVRLPISLDDYSSLNLGDSILRTDSQLDSNTQSNIVLLSAQTGEHTSIWFGNIVRDEGVINTNNRLLYLVVHVDDPYQLKSDFNKDLKQNVKQGLQQGLATRHNNPLRFGSFLNAQIQGPMIAAIARVPRSSLVRDEYVFLINSESQLVKTPVSIVGEEDEFVYVSSSLNTGDQLLNSPILQAIPGMKVTFSRRLESANAQ
jgi:multidrug efflux pump subunit AcrA (membrane-fusion protein)